MSIALGKLLEALLLPARITEFIEVAHVGIVREAVVGHGRLFTARNFDFRVWILLDEQACAVFIEKRNRR